MNEKLRVPEKWTDEVIDENPPWQRVVMRKQNSLIDCVEWLREHQHWQRAKDTIDDGARTSQPKSPREDKPQEYGIKKTQIQGHVQCDHCFGTDLQTQEFLGEKCVRCTCIMNLRDKRDEHVWWTKDGRVHGDKADCPVCNPKPQEPEHRCEILLDAIADGTIWPARDGDMLSIGSMHIDKPNHLISHCPFCGETLK